MADLFSLSGRTALVTGASRGIGRALVQGLATAGARVVVNGLSESGAQTAAAELQAQGFEAIAQAFDVTDAAAVERARSALEARGWVIDVLVNNAGIQRRGLLLELSVDDFEVVLKTNLTSAFITARSFVPAMVRRGGGKVVNVASLMSDLARPTTGNYAAAKGGLRMLTRAMAAEWARHNVQANAIAPGYFETDLTRPLKSDASFDRWLCARTPSGRWGQPHELVGAAVFLASSASDYVCGQVLTVDGGLSAVV